MLVFVTYFKGVVKFNNSHCIIPKIHINVFCNIIILATGTSTYIPTTMVMTVHISVTSSKYFLA